VTVPTDAVMDLAVHTRKHHTPQPGCDWCPEVETARPTDHLAAARAALDCAGGASFGSASAIAWSARAQVHATLALAEEARTANLLAALDYNIASRDDVVARLWPSS